MTEDEKKLIQARHRLEAVQARNRVQERKARTRRLIQEGAILESVWPEVRDIPMADLPRKLHCPVRGSSPSPKCALTHHRQAGGGMCALCGGERLLRK